MAKATKEIIPQEEMCEQIVMNEEVEIAESKFPKPTEEEIEEYTKEMEAGFEAYNNMSDFVISEDAELSKKLYDMAIKYNSELYTWKHDEWKGVIMFDETMKSQEGSERFTIDKNNLQWLYYIITNPSGVGIEKAREMKANEEVFVQLVERITEAMTEFKEIVEDLRFLQDRVAAAHQGFYLRQDGIADCSEEVEG